ncbi:MAG: tyrosine-protein phosphatase [Bacteroidaceae bacterium]|nr:tyrosine-protein phosphatase [Bacteroidaceae bacterium]
MKEKFKWFIASLMVMVCLQAFAEIPEGKYYLYNTVSKVFLSRSHNSANVDQFGIPVEVKKGTNGYSLMFLDNGRYVSQSGTSIKGDSESAAAATIEEIDGGYSVTFTAGELLGVDASGKLASSAEATGFNSLWSLLTQAERDDIVAAQEVAQIEAIAKAAEITLGEGDKKALFAEALKEFKSEDAIDHVTNPELAISQDPWTVSVLAGNNNIAYNEKPMTLYQNSAIEISQTINVPNGIYKATIQNTFRASGMRYLLRLANNDKISICNAYFAANDNKVQAMEWTKIRGSETDPEKPYSRSHFENFTTNPKYTTTVWVYVTDGKLTLKYAVPSISRSDIVQDTYGANWFTFANVTLTRYYKASAEVDEAQFDLYNEIADQSSDPSSYYSALTTVKEQVAAGTLSEDDAKAQLRSKIFELMNAVPALSGQYNITSFLTNPSFDNGIKGWERSGGNFNVNKNIVESFGTTTTGRIYQVLSTMPAGDYTVKVQGFYRNGEWKKALANYERGKDAVKAYVYVNKASNIQPLKSIFADGCYMLKGQSDKSADVFAVVSGRGYPHSHYIGSDRTKPIKSAYVAKQAIDHGHYWNEITTNLAEEGDLTIGIYLAAGAPAENWVAIDNFRLYYGTPAPVTIAEGVGLPPAVFDDTYAPVVLKKEFKADVLTPLAVPCDIPSSKFKAVYAIGSLDEKTQTAVLCPVDHVSANVPCYVKTDKDVDEIIVDEKTYITGAQPDSIPVMWDGGLVYRIPGTFSWTAIALDEKEYDASHFTEFEYVDTEKLDFVANIENFRARQFLENTDYSDPQAISVIGNYFDPAPPRLDIPHNIGVPVPADKVKDAVVKYGLKEDLSDAKSRMVLDGSDMAYMPNLIPGKTYYFQVKAGEEVLTQGKVQVEGPVRMIYAPSINNIRDLGGWTVEDGRTVRYGLIFRGGEMNGLHPSVAEDRETLIDLGVGAEIDLRKDNNYDSANGGVGRCEFGFPSADYFYKAGGYDCKLEHMTASDSKARYKQWFPFILNHIKEGKAVYYHCVWGADRTGLVSVLLEGLLGLSQEQMNLEYELTSLSFAGLRSKGGYGDGDHQKLIEYVKKLEGDSLRDKFDTYWTKQVGITQEQIEEFRSIMLEGVPTDIKDIDVQEGSSQSGIKAVYSITGTELPIGSLNQTGIYVVKYNNGTSQKIVVK